MDLEACFQETRPQRGDHRGDTLQKQGEGILRVEYDTFHGSKGREADIVILNGLVNQKTNRRCFPSRMSENELITLPLPLKESFPDAEERRLFYVALTRARKLVVIPTTFDDMSPFVHELFDFNHIEVELFHQGEVAEECPVCRYGIATFKQGEIVCNSPDCKIGIHAHRPTCPVCKTGRVIPRQSEYGVWFGCNNYPACKFTDRERSKAMNRRLP